MNFALFILIICGMAVAVFWDLRYRKIPNLLTFPMMLAGVGFNSGINGWNGLFYSGGGLFLGICIFILPYMMGGMGAGDVKLLGSTGAILGPKGVIITAIFSVLFGFVYVIMILIFRPKYTLSLLKRLWLTMKILFSTGRFLIFPPQEGEWQPKLKFALPIALGTIAYILLKVSGSTLIQTFLGFRFSI